MKIKKIIGIFTIFGILMLMIGCDFGGDDKDVEPKEIPEEDFVPEDLSVDDEADVDEEEVEEEAEEEEEEIITEEPPPEPEIPSYTGENYITIDSPINNTEFTECPIIFKGVVSPNTEKIIVTASGGTPGADMFGYYEDVYTLQQFNHGDSNFTYRAQMEWDNLVPGSNDYEFKAYYDDGTTKTAYLTVFYTFGGAEMGKPVIYLYPEKAMKVFVDVEPTSGISISEPKIKDGWIVFASPDGKIYNFNDRKVYPYLFWEGYSSKFETPKEGFVVEVSEVSKFFDEKLSILGLNETEIADFKEFWVPRLNKDPYYFITFISQEDFDKYAPLTVNPKPDSIIRVFFDYQGLEEEIDVTEQILTTPDRDGFTVVEWGGRLYR